jgi:hypothetical protein
MGLWVPCPSFGELSLELHYILFPGLGIHSFVYLSLDFIFHFSRLNCFTSIIWHSSIKWLYVVCPSEHYPMGPYIVHAGAMVPCRLQL